jgi:hypothetical protein
MRQGQSSVGQDVVAYERRVFVRIPWRLGVGLVTKKSYFFSLTAVVHFEQTTQLRG